MRAPGMAHVMENRPERPVSSQCCQGKSNHIPTAIASIRAVYRVVTQALKVKRSQPAAAPTGFAYTRKMTVVVDPM